MDAEDAVAAPVAADPTEFGSDLPSYEGGADGDSWAGAYTRPLFGSTLARFVGYSVSVGGGNDKKRLRLS